MRVPKALIQPIAGTEVAAKLAEIALGAAANAVVEFGGPEYFPFENFIGTALTLSGLRGTGLSRAKAA